MTCALGNEDVWHHILSFLPLEGLVVASGVCKASWTAAEHIRQHVYPKRRRPVSLSVDRRNARHIERYYHWGVRRFEFICKKLPAPKWYFHALAKTRCLPVRELSVIVDRPAYSPWLNRQHDVRVASILSDSTLDGHMSSLTIAGASSDIPLDLSSSQSLQTLVSSTTPVILPSGIQSLSTDTFPENLTSLRFLVNLECCVDSVSALSMLGSLSSLQEIYIRLTCASCDAVEVAFPSLSKAKFRLDMLEMGGGVSLEGPMLSRLELSNGDGHFKLFQARHLSRFILRSAGSGCISLGQADIDRVKFFSTIDIANVHAYIPTYVKLVSYEDDVVLALPRDVDIGSLASIAIVTMTDIETVCSVHPDTVQRLSSRGVALGYSKHPSYLGHAIHLFRTCKLAVGTF